MNKKFSLCALFILGILLVCTGCKKAPEVTAVIAKDDSLCDTSAFVSKIETCPMNDSTDISFNSTFTSTDGSVDFTMNINNKVNNFELPIAQVQPHVLTAEDVKRVAYALFPGAEFYEAEPEISELFSKSEIQSKLSRWSQYTNIDALTELYGSSVSAGYLDIIEGFIQDYTTMYELAPTDNPHKPCAWKMRKESEYIFSPDECAAADLTNDSDEISTQFSVNGIPYILSATTRDKRDFKVNIITCTIYDGLCPRDLDERIFAAQLCRTDEPTQEQIDAVALKAEQLLSAFNLGQWKIDERYIVSTDFGNHEEYVVHVNAVPTFNGVSALRHPQLASLKDKSGYAPSQYLTDAQFSFAPSGELLSFTLFTPLNTQEVIDEHVKVMSMGELLNRAQEILTLTDSNSYGFGEYMQLIDEEVKCNVEVSEVKYGLSRIKVPDTDGTYYYVPSLLLKGVSEYVGKESGKTFYASEKPEVLAVINAVDGTLINGMSDCNDTIRR